MNVPKQRNTKEENDTIKEGETPESFKENPAKLAQKDCDARWASKNKETHYGYKNHVNVDMKTKLITKFTTSSASVHDSQATEELLNEEDSIAYADSAYRSEKIEAYLKSQKCKSHIHEKGYRNKALDIGYKPTNGFFVSCVLKFA